MYRLISFRTSRNVRLMFNRHKYAEKQTTNFHTLNNHHKNNLLQTIGNQEFIIMFKISNKSI
jgi:hypothetical protein